jgi:glycosyltransferase involved in cell wall biosynthesis
MGCGCPVAVSDIPAHREICGETAMYFDPFSPEDILSKLDALLRLDSVARTSLIKCGLQRASGYSWENSKVESPSGCFAFSTNAFTCARASASIWKHLRQILLRTDTFVKIRMYV